VPKAAELVAGALRRQIITGELNEEDVLPSEALLMTRFGVSRPTLREAFRILESESLIVVRRGARGGARVKTPNGDVAARYLGYILQYRGTTMTDVFEARAAIEAPIARLVATRPKRALIARLDEAIAAAEPHLGDPDAYVGHDLAFHLLLAELTKNQTLGVIIDMIYHMVTEARHRLAASTGRSETRLDCQQVHKAHAHMVELVRSGDPDAAEVFWRKHLDDVYKHYRARPLAKTVVEMTG
jgi:DNA-binding FadR family transcriptional regulator